MTPDPARRPRGARRPKENHTDYDGERVEELYAELVEEAEVLAPTA